MQLTVSLLMRPARTAVSQSNSALTYRWVAISVPSPQRSCFWASKADPCRFFPSESVKWIVAADVDLAVSKISRLSDNDKRDIADLVRSGCTNAIAIEKRANEAVGGYIGNMKEVRQNISSAVSIARQAEPKIYRAPKKDLDFGR